MRDKGANDPLRPGADMSTDFNALPKVTHGDIGNYLVYSASICCPRSGAQSRDMKWAPGTARSDIGAVGVDRGVRDRTLRRFACLRAVALILHDLWQAEEICVQRLPCLGNAAMST
ncbi:hypothetical protein HPB52_006196 [Rhipicephalus sanguineus]|uniref:Uncharacterized protein n=1 Tax=Rhipicephalus sanguineus TaxID=34632 RepID=A0A9D4PL16_RHISA|nr:hypothetical protein HPB52_006196 [Rhipicephalus sanguineus]